MRGHRFSSDIRETVSRAAKLGLDPTIIEAVTGVSKCQIQRIASEEHGDLAQNQDRSRRVWQRVLKSEHLEVSDNRIAVIRHFFTERAPLFTSS
jgi:hypothetical protein